MSLVHWDPFRELDDMSGRLNRIWRRDLAKRGDEPKTRVADWMPVVDIEETHEDYIVRAELPEISKEDVKVSVQNGVLTLTGERKLEEEEKNKKYHRIERSYGTFVRSFSLPENVQPEKVKAEYKDGLLSIHVPKAPEAKPQAIEIKVQ